MNRERIVTRWAIDHATRHLDKPLYQCRQCSKWKTYRLHIAAHIWQVHHHSIVDAFTDHSLEYTDEILRMLDNCYDTDKEIDGIDLKKIRASGWRKKMKRKQRSFQQNVRHTYNLRSRSANDLKEGEKTGLYTKLRKEIKMTAGKKLIYNDGALYKCCYCSKVSRHRALVYHHMILHHWMRIEVDGFLNALGT